MHAERDELARSLRSHLDHTFRHGNDGMFTWVRKNLFDCSDNDRNGETAEDCQEFIRVNRCARMLAVTQSRGCQQSIPDNAPQRQAELGEKGRGTRVRRLAQNATGEHDCYGENDEDPQSPPIKAKLDRTGLGNLDFSRQSMKPIRITTSSAALSPLTL